MLYQQVYEGVLYDISELAEHTVFKKCGYQDRTELTSKGYTYTVAFVSDDSGSAKGFKAEFTQVWKG